MLRSCHFLSDAYVLADIVIVTVPAAPETPHFNGADIVIVTVPAAPDSLPDLLSTTYQM